MARPIEVALPSSQPFVHIFHMRECDPRKCTALRLGKLGLAKIYYSIGALPPGSLLLYPFARELLTPQDRPIVSSRGISAIDCSWNRIRELPLPRRFHIRQLPFMLAANPTNYSIPFKLSTIEAISSVLFITGFTQEAKLLLSKVKWGQTFLTLNREPLELYSKSKDAGEVKLLSDEYARLYSA